jgi:HK97 family phage major capsid protein
MATFNSLVSRGNVVLTSDQLSEIFGAAAEQSVVFTKARQLRTMQANELTLNVLSALPSVYFVGEKGSDPTGTFSHLKQTTSAEWEGVTLTAAELAVIIPVPISLVQDAAFPVLDEVRPLLVNAIAAKVDQSVFFGGPGTDVPASWPSGIVLNMPANHKVASTAFGDIYNAILGPSGTYSRVEQDGYEVNGNIAGLVMKGRLRGLRDGAGGSVGMPVFNQTPNTGRFSYELDGVGTAFDKLGSLDLTKALMITGDWDKLVWSIRQDIQFDRFDSGVITDAAGVIVHNLMQEDLVALRCTFRMGWALPNPINYINSSAATRYPFAALVP